MSEFLIISVQIEWKTGIVETLHFLNSEEIGIHTKHLVGPLEDPVRGPGISLRRNDTNEEFAWIPSGSYKEIKFIWNRALP